MIVSKSHLIKSATLSQVTSSDMYTAYNSKQILGDHDHISRHCLIRLMTEHTVTMQNAL